MSTPIQERYPLEPLRRLAELRWGIDADKPSTTKRGACRPEHRVFSDVVFAELVGVHPRQIVAWRQTGGVPLASAERAAINLGLTIHMVWPDLYWSRCPPEPVFEDGDRVCPACEGPIKPGYNRTVCSSRCRNFLFRLRRKEAA